jgi:hypothetical protein
LQIDDNSGIKEHHVNSTSEHKTFSGTQRLKASRLVKIEKNEKLNLQRRLAIMKNVTRRF